MCWQGSDRFDYGMRSILNNAPVTSGVYATYSRGTWLTVGASGDIRASLLSLLLAKPYGPQNQPTHFAYEPAAATARGGRLQELIAEFHPVGS
jgi:hypothetical protein